MTRSRFRHLVFASLHASLVVAMVPVACVDTAAGVPPSSRSLGLPPPPFDGRSAWRLPSAPTSPKNADVMNIGGTVLNDDGDLVVGRPLVVIDADGRRFEEMTDEGGGFWAMGAKPPYDLALDPAPSGHSPVPFVVLGVTRSDPTFEVSEHFDGMPVQTLRVAIALPPALAASSSVWASAVSRSTSGAGSATVAGGARPDPSQLVLSIDHVLRVDEPPSDEAIALHVLVGAGSGAGDGECDETFAYVHLANISVSPGTVTELGPAPASVVPTRGPTAVAVSDPRQASWSRSVRIEADDASLELPWRTDAPALRWPEVPGMKVRLRAFDGGAEASSRREVWSEAAAVLPSSVTLAAFGDLALVQPAGDASLPRSASGVSWQASPGGVFEITLTDGVGRRLFRALTAEPALDFARLERLGVARPDIGAFAVELVQRAIPGIDAALASDPDARAAARRAAGASSHLRRPLDVVP